MYQRYQLYVIYELIKYTKSLLSGLQFIMVKIKNSKEQFYYAMEKNEILKHMKIFDILKNKYLSFYDICAQFVNISLNSSKTVISGTYVVQGYFHSEDINIAKRAAKAFYDENSLQSIDEYMKSIKIMYRFAVDFNGSRCTTGFVQSENSVSSYGIFGKYYSFKEMPKDIWEKVEKETRKFILND